jgi:uncharacterized membrane protein
MPIEYLTRIAAGIFVRHFSIHAQQRIAISSNESPAFFLERISWGIAAIIAVMASVPTLF